METQNQNGTGPGTALATRSDTALAVTQAVNLEAYIPRTYEQAFAMATTLSKAAGVTPEEAFLKMATGAEFGIPAVSALRMVDIIPGPNNTKQVGLRAQLMVGLCLRAKGICEYIRHVEGDDKSATWAAKRVGEPEQRETYTIEQAAQAGLVKDGGAWKKDPRSQLVARASSRLARRVFPDLVGNLYTPDELQEAADGGRAAPVQPLPGTAKSAPAPAHDAQTGEVRDAEFTEKESDEARIVRLLGEATTPAAVGALALEATKIWTDKATRPESVRAAHQAARARFEKPAASAPAAAAAAPAEREPGQEG